MAINYDDERFKAVEQEEASTTQRINDTYDTMINKTDDYYNNMINAVEDYKQTQSDLQQANTDFAIQEIENQRAEAEKDYEREQRAAYTDYMKQSNQYGANAEYMAQSGLSNTGYSASNQIAMYKTYQNRVATARETITKANLEYDKSIEQARLTNNAQLAEIAYSTLTQKLQLALNGFQYQNQLLLSQLDALNNTSDRYYSRKQDIVNQINTENALEENKRQFNASLAEQRRQYNNTYQNYTINKDNDDLSSLKYSNTGAELDGLEIFKASNGKYYSKNGDSFIETPVVQETDGYLMLDDGEILTKVSKKK